MSLTPYFTTVNVCEDTNKTFDILDLLVAAGYTPNGDITIADIAATEDADVVALPTPLVRQLSDTTIEVTASNLANYNGSFYVFTLSIDLGDGTEIYFDIQVIIEPVNDAPNGADQTVDLVDGSAYILQESNFGFQDVVEGDAFKSVVIGQLPPGGHLLLNGSPVTAGQEISIDDIRAGKLSFLPSENASGTTAFSFQVRDDGGVEGCNAADLSIRPNHLTFNIPKASVGDFVWHDTDRDGIQDSTEAGVSGVTVTLKGAGADGQFNTADDTTYTTTTDANGKYSFEGVNAGKYTVEFSGVDASKTFTTTDAGSDSLDSDALASGQTGVFTLTAGQNRTDIDAGLVDNVGSIGDKVFFDANGNGLQDSGEAGIQGLTVTLTGAGADGVLSTADDTVQSTTTDANGNYLFNNLQAGQYQVNVSGLTSTQAFTSQDQGAQDAVDSDVDGSGNTAVITLAAGQNNLDVDAGVVTKKASLGDTVFFDANENGLQDAGEAGLQGMGVTLTGAGADDQFGTADDTVQTTTTDTNGKYSFNNLNAGQYQVQFTDTTGLGQYTLQNQGSDDSVDSDADGNGLTQVVTLNPGDINDTVDGGLILKRGAIGDRVFNDANGNGVQDGNEAGVAGVTVTLQGAGFDGSYGTADDINRTATTDANGNYLFDNLSSGQLYAVNFSGIPANYQFTQQDAGSDNAIDSDADSTGQTAPVYLNPGETNLSLDAGIVEKTGSIGDIAFFDNNRNGIQDAGDTAAAGVTVTLAGAGADGTFGTADDTTATTTTNAHGQYLFSGLKAGDYQVNFGTVSGYDFTTANSSDDTTDSDAGVSGSTGTITLAAGENNTTVDAGYVQKLGSIGDRVWLDSNNNGLQDSTETGVAGVTVTLKGAGADGALGTADDTTRTTTTDSAGKYLFTGLAAGSYQVSFAGLQAGQTFTTQDVGSGSNEATDSDVSSAGVSSVVTLTAGQTNIDVDAGVVNTSLPNACVGDVVWNDCNKNGLQDCGEDGIAGVKVTLIGAGFDGHFGTADDISKSTTTDSCGNYKFTGLYGNQQYQIQFGAVSGYGLTTQDVGSNDRIDSDANSSTGLTRVFTLANGECNTTIDAGYYCKPPASVGDYVWFDCNKNGIQDCDEDGVSGVTVTLKGAGADGHFGTADDISKTTTTDACGYYKFTGLTGGQQYQIQFGTKAGYTYTLADQGNSGNLDSDANQTTGLSHVFTLADGQHLTNVDAGLVCKPLASVGDRVWIDGNRNGLQDSGESGAACISVKLTGAGADGQFGTADDIVKTTTTDECGFYKFTGLTGDQQYQIEFGTARGYTWTTQDVGTNDATDSDASASTGKTAAFTLAAGQNLTSIDAGLVCKPTASVGDRVWVDADGDGIQDSGEAGVACVTVKLFGAGADGIFGNTDDVCQTTTTDNNGCYKFSGLVGGEQYKIQFGTVSGYTFTGQNKGSNAAVDSDAGSNGWTNAFTLAAGEHRTTVDAGLIKQVSACIVGSSTLYEGCSNNYQIKLSAAVSTDTWLKVAAVDGSAYRTSTNMANQEIMAGGRFDTRNWWGGVTGVYHDQIPNNLSSISFGTRKATGPTNMTADYALYGTDCVIDADGSIMVRVAAGQTTSASFSLAAWQERVFVDGDIFPWGGYKETAWETMSLRLSDSSNAQVVITSSSLNVSIGDTTAYTLFSPIALDLDGNGIQTTALIDSQGTFDLLGTGKAVHSGWLSSGDAFLAIDTNGNSKIDDISELFGGNKGDGFAKLASFDTNGDGLVDANDADFGQLLVWQDANGNHATDAGELRTLAEAGIASLTVSYTDGAVNQLGNVLGETSTATRTDGSAISMVDVYFNVDADSAALPDLGSVLSSTNSLLDQALGTATASPAIEAANDAAVVDAEALRKLAALMEQQAAVAA
jgi:serine-aspartate repeat-containing protein C/D/E